MNSIEELYPTTNKRKEYAIFTYSIKGQGLEISTSNDFTNYNISKRNDNLLVIKYNQFHAFSDKQLFRACDTNNFVMISHTCPAYSYRRNIMIIKKNNMRCYRLPQTSNELSFIELTNNMVYIRIEGILVFDDLIYRINNMYVQNYKLDDNSVISIIKSNDSTSTLIYYNLVTSESLKLCLGNIEFDNVSKKLTVNSNTVNIQDLIENKRKDNTIYQSYKEDGVVKLFK